MQSCWHQIQAKLIMIGPTSGKACYLSECQVKSNAEYRLRFHIIQVHEVNIINNNNKAKSHF